jgi:hypothetical protein
MEQLTLRALYTEMQRAIALASQQQFQGEPQPYLHLLEQCSGIIAELLAAPKEGDTPQRQERSAERLLT